LWNGFDVMEAKNFEQGILDCIAYMLTSARGLIDEPRIYGPFRLADGVSRLCALLAENGHKDKEFLENLQKKIDEKKYSVMTDQEAFVSLLDDVIIDITHMLMKKSNN